jgi:alkanesulfonate monooxygenase SsuD/methylene tetrahydromethanopterin reductase-like flavin-dependent oxidoreductase (luciferase family)
MMNVGLSYPYFGDREDSADPARQSVEPHWAATLDHMVWAEELGFDSIWLGEHHFEKDHLPSPLLLAAALAMRTSRVRMCGWMLAPLYHPVRLAEECAMVSVLSHGRIDLGTGMGHFPLEFEALGVNIKHRPSLLEETVEICRRAWTGKPFSFEGKRYTIPEVTITPVPAQQPRVLIAASAEPAVRRAARIGDGFLANNFDGIDVYVDELERLGKSGVIYSGQNGIVVEDPERFIAEESRYAVGYCNDLIDRNYLQRAYYENIQDAIEEGVYVVRDAATAIKELDELARSYPLMEGVSFMVTSGPGEPLDATSERIQYFADRVLPELHDIRSAATT